MNFFYEKSRCGIRADFFPDVEPGVIIISEVPVFIGTENERKCPVPLS